jgi:hypothetical protein
MKISNQKLAIGIPLSWPFVPAPFFRSFNMMEKPDYIYIQTEVGGIDVLRNDIVEKALSEGATHLLLCDVDQIYPVNLVTKLLSHNLPVVGARVHRRYAPFDSLILRKVEIDERTNGYEPIDDWEEGELLECDATGGGCVMYNMEVFRKIPKPWFEFKKQEGGAVIGEDILMCQKIKAAGYKIFVDTSLECGHLTTMIVNRKTNLLYRSMKQKQHQQNLEKAIGAGKEVA